jgi:phosphatidylglycerophosphate synthase
MHKTSYYIINGITLYRLIAAPVLLLLIFYGQVEIFGCLLAFSFFTDAIDGFLARRYKVASVMGARLDSLADDLTVVVAFIALFLIKKDFVVEQILSIFILLGLYLVQTILAFVKYGKVSNFHTYLAKAAAVFQGIFFILIFFLPKPPMTPFYAAVIITVIDLIEEIILVLILSKWEVNVKGLYWVLKRKTVLNKLNS